MLYHIRVTPLARDCTVAKVRDLFRDFGDIYSVRIHRAPKIPRYNRITRRKDIFDPCHAVVAYTDSNACRLAILNLDNTLVHPITKKHHEIAEITMMGQMPIRRALRVQEYEHPFSTQ